MRRRADGLANGRDKVYADILSRGRTGRQAGGRDGRTGRGTRTRREHGRGGTAGIASLSNHFGNRLATGRAIREQHANSITWLENQAPDAVVFAESTEDVQFVVRACAAHGVPVIAFGTGSSLEGQINAPKGGISLDLSRMNRVLAVHTEDLDCVSSPA